MAKSFTYKPEPVANTNEILVYLHCAKCIREKPEGVSPKEWSRTQAGWTKQGIQVWCNRHNCNIVHISFEGACHPANTFTAEQTEAAEKKNKEIQSKQKSIVTIKKGRNKP